MEIFPLQASKKEDIELIKKIKLLHSKLRDETILTTKQGHTKIGIWNSVKTIREILKTSDYAYILQYTEEELKKKLY